MISGPDTPFGSEDVPEVNLDRSPLVEVLAQVRFPAIMGLSRGDSLIDFQNALRREYPVLRQEQQTVVVIASQGLATAPQDTTDTLWRFSDGEGTWTLTVAPNFIALDTKRYRSREDFFERLERALAAFEEHVSPVLYDRLGVRYVNRLSEPAQLERLPSLVRPQVLGFLSATQGEPPPKVVTAQCAIEYELPEGRLLVRSALLPPRSTYDPSVQPTDSSSWLLDIDMSTRLDAPSPFDATLLAASGRRFGGRIYRFFRWSMTDEFMREAGPRP